MNVIKNRISLYIVIAVAVILLIGGIIAATYSGNPDSPTRLLSLGEKYLSELNYEQALVQFLKVIEIEPMNPRGYSGAAEAYAGLEEYRNAVDILNKGIEITGDASLAEFLQKMNIGIVSGKVCDALSYFTGQTDFNLENAKVSAVNTSIKAYTNTEGEYNFYLPAGQYKLLAEYSGYMPMVLEFKLNHHRLKPVGSGSRLKPPKVR